jgi:hypothetical protein
MKIKIGLAAISFLLSTSSFAITCDTLYQETNFQRVVLSADGGGTCYYQNNISFPIGETVTDFYKPSHGKWDVKSPRKYSCESKNSSDCEFEKI